MAVLGGRGLIAPYVGNELSVGLLMLLIGLVPIDALDALFETLIAIFAGARSIFFRRYVLAPGLKLVAVVGVMAVQGSVYLLAIAYLVAGFLGIALYALLLRRTLKAEGLLHGFKVPAMKVPARELIAYSVPLMTTDLILAIEIAHWSEP